MEFWHERRASFREDRAVVKLFNNDGTFKASAIVPTQYYPLNGEYEVFTYKNTKPVKNAEVLSVFDEVEYRIGRCYTNTEELVKRLNARGINAKSYAGWLFLSDSEYPVHHCWTVLTDEDGTHILDLSDDYTAMLSGENGKHFAEVGSVEEQRELMASFALAAKKVPNHVRCSPVGMPTAFMLYIGCECEPNEGRKIYNRLMAMYPNHECERNCDAQGMNATQKVMAKYGLME